jgi:hypothetical protein
MNNKRSEYGSGILASWLNKRQKTSETSTLKITELASSEVPNKALSTENIPSRPSSSNKYKEHLSADIGDYFDKPKLINDYNKVRLLELSNILGNDFIYPHSVHIKKGKEKKRFLQ